MVGYAAVAFERHDALADPLGHALLAHARNAIADALGQPPAQARPPALARRRHLRHAAPRRRLLRGCIGSAGRAPRAARHDVRLQRGVRLTFRDHRFTPLAPGVSDRWPSRVSLLGPRIVAASEDDALPNSTRPRRVTLFNRSRHATFLPQVWGTTAERPPVPSPRSSRKPGLPEKTSGPRRCGCRATGPQVRAGLNGRTADRWMRPALVLAWLERRASASTRSKKPLNHFLPGTASSPSAPPAAATWPASSARTGTSQVARDGPPDGRRRARAHRAGGRAACLRERGLHHNDPVIFAEYAMDVADACHELASDRRGDGRLHARRAAARVLREDGRGQRRPEGASPTTSTCQQTARTSRRCSTLQFIVPRNRLLAGDHHAADPRPQTTARRARRDDAGSPSTSAATCRCTSPPSTPTTR